MTCVLTHSGPISAGHDWPLYGDEYGRMKFGNYQERQTQVSSERLVILKAVIQRLPCTHTCLSNVFRNKKSDLLAAFIVNY